MKYVRIILLGICISISCMGCAWSNSRIADICTLIENNQNEEAKNLIDKTGNLNQLSENNVLLKYIFTQSDFDRSTPLVSACKSGNLEMMIYLLESGADPNYTKGDIYYPLEALCTKGTNMGTEGIEILLEYGADPNLYTFQPPAFVMAYNLCWTINYGKGIYDEYQNRFDMILYLLDHGAKAYREDGWTMLHYAVQFDRTDFLQQVLQVKGSQRLINQQDEDGNTPLHIAAMNKKEANYIYLLQNGAEIDIKNQKGKTAEDYFKEE